MSNRRKLNMDRLAAATARNLRDDAIERQAWLNTPIGVDDPGSGRVDAEIAEWHEANPPEVRQR